MKKKIIMVLFLFAFSMYFLSSMKVAAKTLSDREKVEMEINNIYVPEKAIIDFPVVSESVYGAIIIWESSNPQIAKVDQSGKITALSAGTPLPLGSTL